MEFRRWVLNGEAVPLEAEEGVVAEVVAVVEPAEAVDRAGILEVAAVEVADSIRTAVAGKAAAGIADTPEGQLP